PRFYDGTCPNNEIQGQRPSSLTPITVKDMLRLGTSAFHETVIVSGRKAELQQIRKKHCPYKQRKFSRSEKKWVPLMSEKPRAEKRREKNKNARKKRE
uniref:Transposase n=1 Tax=Bursaphelenchus xylophilus TaxID=6326 RepID=A0A1I7SPL7_BURXY